MVQTHLCHFHSFCTRWILRRNKKERIGPDWTMPCCFLFIYCFLPSAGLWVPSKTIHKLWLIHKLAAGNVSVHDNDEHSDTHSNFPLKMTNSPYHQCHKKVAKWGTSSRVSEKKYRVSTTFVFTVSPDKPGFLRDNVKITHIFAQITANQGAVLHTL